MYNWWQHQRLPARPLVVQSASRPTPTSAAYPIPSCSGAARPPLPLKCTHVGAQHGSPPLTSCGQLP